MREEQPSCQWKGCTAPGRHRAPRGRGRDGEFFIFCLDHVRQYNASYNYFDGMNNSEVEKFQKDALTGHGPTWKVGVNGRQYGSTSGGAAGGEPAASNGSRLTGWRALDPHGFFARRAKEAREAPAENRRS